MQAYHKCHLKTVDDPKTYENAAGDLGQSTSKTDLQRSPRVTESLCCSPGDGGTFNVHSSGNCNAVTLE